MRRVTWITAAILALLLVFMGGLMVRLPAGHFLDYLLEGRDDIRWTRAQGTVWAGQADIAWLGYDAGTVSWTLSGGSLLIGAVTGEVRVQGGEIEAQGYYAGDWNGAHVELQNVRVQAPASWLQHVLAAPFLQLGGRLTADLSTVEFGKGRLVNVIGVARWHDAVVGGNVATRLGGLQVDFQRGSGIPLEGVVSDLGGPLSAVGVVTIGDRGYAVDVRLAARNDDVQLRQALEVLGRFDRNGDVHLKISGPMVTLW